MGNNLTDKDEEDSKFRGLMLAAQQGDVVAYRELLSEITPRIDRFIRNRVGYDPSLVEDTVQEALLVIHRNRHVYDPGRPFFAWMYAIVRHKLIDRIRAERIRVERWESLETEHVTIQGDDSYTTAGALVVRWQQREYEDEAELERRALLQRAMEKLGEKYRQAIILVKIEGYSIAEAAGELQISVSAMKVRVHRGMTALIEELVGKDE